MNALTGFVSVDRPQEKYYRKTPISNIDVNQTVYELIFNSNRENLDDYAIEYLGKSWTFKELKKETDKAADSFFKLGIRHGDVILVGISNSPEAIIILLSLNKIGAITKWFDIRASENDIKEYANTSNCKCLIILDFLISKVQLILKNTSLQNVLVIKPTDSLSNIIQAGYQLKQKMQGIYASLPSESKFMYFKDFIKKGDADSNIPCMTFDKEKPSIMIQSSGTTGKPKTIVHSDYSATSCARMFSYWDLPLGRGKTIAVFLPPWIAYALGNAIITPLALGTKLLLSPTFDSDVIIKHLGKFTISFAAPFHYRYLRDNFGKLSQKQMEYVKQIECMVSGGDKISAEENKEFEAIFDTVLVNGYGNNEGWGALTVNPVNHNKYGTIGIPKYGETIISYDNKSGRELRYGEEGEICALADTMFLYYEGNMEQTNDVKRVHADGKAWLHTGDLGTIVEDGYISLSGRLRRVIVRGGFKISAYTIEDKISEHAAVKECVAVEVEDSQEEHVPMVYIVLKDFDLNLQDIQDELLQKCCSELKEYEIPKYFRFVDTLPYTQNGKYDFRLLEQMGNEYVNKCR